MANDRYTTMLESQLAEAKKWAEWYRDRAFAAQIRQPKKFFILPWEKSIDKVGKT